MFLILVYEMTTTVDSNQSFCILRCAYEIYGYPQDLACIVDSLPFLGHGTNIMAVGCRVVLACIVDVWICLDMFGMSGS